METQLRTAEITSKENKGGRCVIADLKMTKMMGRLDGSTNSMGVNRGDREMVRDGRDLLAAIHGVVRNWTQISN